MLDAQNKVLNHELSGNSPSRVILTLNSGTPYDHPFCSAVAPGPLKVRDYLFFGKWIGGNFDTKSGCLH